MVRARIRNEKLRENWYREEYARSIEGKRVEGDGDNVKHMWVESMGVGGKNPKCVVE